MSALTKKDVDEGKELISLIENLPEEERKQAVIYIRALSDRAMIVLKGKQESVKEVV